MKGTYRLGSAFGIPIQVHWTFLILAAVLMIGSPTWLVVLPVLFLCVLLHELGHSLAARRFGIHVVDITLLPIGGMARMAQMPEDAKTEGIVAFAGPAVNFGLAALGLVGLLISVAAGAAGSATLFAGFIWMNLILGGFNLIPAFPMDGGRILRSLLALRTDWVAATEGAVRVGRWVALLMVLSPILLPFLFPGFQGGTFMLPLIALFVWFAGGRELIGVRLRHGLPPFKNVRFAGMPGTSPGFDPTAGGARPAQAEESREDEGPRVTVERPGPAEAGTARRPEVWETVDDEVPRPSAGGFGADELRALERFHGRLRRQPRSDVES